ncbi:MAG TPA: hypothetical protein DCS93_12805 [Microscillaceae bacterium]|nr:hypothetical protein [Microscillaceae bacterium]
MSTTLDIPYISNKLNQSLGADSVYTLQKDTTADPERLQDLFNFLQADSLTVNGGSLTASETNALLEGSIDYLLGYSNAAIQLHFQQDNDIVNTTLTLTPPANQVLNFKGLWLPLTNTTLKFSLTGEFNISAMEMEGDVLYITSLRLRLVKIADDQWQVNLIQPGNEPIAISRFIEDLFAFGEYQPGIDSFIPTEVAEQLGSVHIDSLNTIFNPAAGSISFFEAGVSSTQEWKISNQLSIKNLAIRLAISNPLKINEEIIGRLEGEIAVTDAFDAKVVVANKTADLWTLEILAPDGGGVSIPSITDIFELAGADVSGLPAAIRTLPALILEEFRVSFVSTPGFIEEFSTRISTASSWEIIPEYLSFTDITVAVELQKNPTWLFTSGGIATTWRLGNSVEILFGAQANNNIWTFVGSLVKPLNFKDLLQDQLQLPADFPDIILESANVTATPSAQTFHLDALVAVDTSNSLDIPLTATRIGGSLDVYREGTQTQYEGQILLEVDLSSTRLVVEASLGNTAGVVSLDFNGRTEGDIRVVDFIADLQANPDLGIGNEVVIPEPLKTLTLKNLELSFNTATKNFTFHGEADFELNGQTTIMTVAIEVSKPGGSAAYEVYFGGSINFAGHLFSLDFSKTAGELLFAASYHHSGKPATLSLPALLKPLLGDDVSIPIPNISIVLEKAIIAIYKPSNVGNNVGSTKVLFNTTTTIGADLHSLPVVGESFVPGSHIHIKNLGIIIANGPWAEDELTKINALLEPRGVGVSQVGSAGIPSGVTSDTANVEVDLSALGIALPAALGTEFSEAKTDIDTTESTPASSPEVPAIQPATTQPGKWFDIHKNIGPVALKRIGLVSQQQTIFFLIDGNLSLGGLSFDALGLGVGFDVLNEFTPSFHLSGLGLEFRQGPIEISGAFLYEKLTLDCNGTEKIVDQYAGGASIRVPQFSLTALGAYATTCTDAPSLFVYAALNAPLAGIPGIIMLTGISFAFGYNRKLIAPDITEVATYPLVAQAAEGTVERSLTETIQDIKKYMPISEGDMFIGAGLKFTIFNLLDSVAFLAVSFGNQLRIDLLGLSTLQVPSKISGNVDPLAKIQLALRVSILPDEGFISVEGRLTDESFVFARECQVRGGFAFYTWTQGAYEGDFVISVGGYHPNYVVPSHYPSVPRLSLNWQISPELTFKGSMYFALTPNAFMAGGSLDATYDGIIKAWFRAGAHFLISWKPYYYDVRLYIYIGANINLGLFTVAFEVGADLHIWGPEFSGVARVKLGPIALEIKFGEEVAKPAPIDWAEFQTSFLPATNDVVHEDKYTAFGAEGGLTKQISYSDHQWWVINSKELKMNTHSVIPFKTASYALADASSQSITVVSDASNDFGLKPMAFTGEKVESNQTVRVDKMEGIEWVNSSQLFNYEVIYKAVPTALWGADPNANDVNDPTLIQNVATGFSITPKEQPEKGVTQSILIDRLQQVTPEAINASAPAIAVAAADVEVLSAGGLASIQPTANNQALAQQLLGITLDAFGEPLQTDDYQLEA